MLLAEKFEGKVINGVKITTGMVDALRRRVARHSVALQKVVRLEDLKRQLRTASPRCRGKLIDQLRSLKDAPERMARAAAELEEFTVKRG